MQKVYDKKYVVCSCILLRTSMVRFEEYAECFELQSSLLATTFEKVKSVLDDYSTKRKRMENTMVTLSKRTRTQYMEITDAMMNANMSEDAVVGVTLARSNNMTLKEAGKELGIPVSRLYRCSKNI